jgi:putative FmdB family regulatory protein
MPIYEYRCPEGHTFERFQSMTAPAPERCDLCGASPVEVVLYPVAIHYKGSGFYSTDYGKRKQAGESSAGDSGSSGDSGSAGDSGSSGDSSSSKGEGKPAADAKPAAKKPES